MSYSRIGGLTGLIVGLVVAFLMSINTVDGNIFGTVVISMVSLLIGWFMGSTCTDDRGYHNEDGYHPSSVGGSIFNGIFSGIFGGAIMGWGVVGTIINVVSTKAF